ncbi:MAG TPA: hypothetical protein V6C85_02160 [Allocoleopsis sp.]
MLSEVEHLGQGKSIHLYLSLQFRQFKSLSLVLACAARVQTADAGFVY